MYPAEVIAILTRAEVPRILHEGDWHGDAGGVWLANPDKAWPDPVALRMLARPDSSQTPCVSGAEKDEAIRLAAMLPELVAALVLAHRELAHEAAKLTDAPESHRIKFAARCAASVLAMVKEAGR